MRLRPLSASIAGFLALGLVLAAPRTASAGPIIYSIGDGGGSLIRFNADSPGAVSKVGDFGGDNIFLDSIDFRPADGNLYGYLAATDTYYQVDTATAALTAVGSSPAGAPANTFFLGMDWNPTIDKLRVVTDSGQNIVYDPATGTSSFATDLSYTTGDPNEQFGPSVIENAYTNSFAGATTTTQYALDYSQNVLATLANNSGVLTTVGSVTVDGTVLDFSEYAGFDILPGPGGTNTAYALLSESDDFFNQTHRLYTIDLDTGAATLLGDLGTKFGLKYGLAVSSAVPEPSSLILCGLGVVGLAGAAIRRRRV